MTRPRRETSETPRESAAETRLEPSDGGHEDTPDLWRQESPTPFSRRRALQVAGGAVAGATAAFGRAVRAGSPDAKVAEIRTISPAGHYNGWPTLARRSNGQLWVVCSGGRRAHVCPFGRVEAMTSDDDGRTWTWPRVLHDGPIDDRDAGVVETAKGTLLVTTFTSLAYKPILERARANGGKPGGWSADRLAAWNAADARLPAEAQREELGVWMLRSTDGGRHWSAPARCLVNSPHGPVPIADGRVLYAGKELWTEGNRIGVAESSDDGRTWRWLAAIPTRPGDDHRQYHELHLVESLKGRLVVHIRNHNAKHAGETLQSESDDGGKTWSVPHTIGVWGLPSFLTRLRDGRLLMSYGHRRKPFGNQARISGDEGRTWSAPLTISADGASGDLGYPSTVELADGALLTVWYEKPRNGSLAVLRQARWTLG